MGKYNKKLILSVDEELINRLRSEAKRLKISVASLCRIGLVFYLDKSTLKKGIRN